MPCRNASMEVAVAARWRSCCSVTTRSPFALWAHGRHRARARRTCARRRCRGWLPRSPRSAASATHGAQQPAGRRYRETRSTPLQHGRNRAPRAGRPMTGRPARRRRVPAPTRRAGRAPSGTRARRRHPGLTVAARCTSIDSIGLVFPYGPIDSVTRCIRQWRSRAPADSLHDEHPIAPARVGRLGQM
jgi:hypothetical protein